MMTTRAVFFDVDFTLIHPGPMFQGEGYAETCARHGMTVDATAFREAAAGAASLLDVQDLAYDPELFLEYTREIIRAMGGTGDGLDACALEVYEAWARCEHFLLYDDVPAALGLLRRRGLQIGLISNTHRCLDSFQRHFELDGVFAATVTSADHGYMKPHPSIFQRALDAASVPAAEAVMVGDSLEHDVVGARAVGMRAVLVERPGRPAVGAQGVPVVRALTELVDHI